MSDSNAEIKALAEFFSGADWEKHLQNEAVRQHACTLRDAIINVESGKDPESDSKPELDIAGATRVKLVVVGDGAVGKTSLLISYATNKFPTEYVPTVFENYTAQMQRTEQTILLHLWDTAGQEDYDRLRPLSYPGTDVALLCFSTVTQSSLDSIREKWSPEVKHYIDSAPLVLVGTKIDLREDSVPDPTSGKFEPVTTEQGKAMAKEIGAACYMECSAKTRENLEDVFNAAVNLVLEQRHPGGKQDPNGKKRGGKADRKKTCALL